MNKILPIYRSHYSFKSILTLESPKGNLDSYPTSIFDLVLDSKQDFVCIVDNNMGGFLEAAKNCKTNKLKLIFGLRLEFSKDINQKDEASLKTRSTYIVVAKNKAGYDALIKIWSCAAKQGFYYNACMDFTNLKRLWVKDLMLIVPFYDSFLHLNSLEGFCHIPELQGFNPIFLLEDNDLPFDDILRKKVLEFTSRHGFDTLESQTIYYKNPNDFLAYMTYRCIQSRSTIEMPDLGHMCSHEFNYEKWKIKNGG